MFELKDIKEGMGIELRNGERYLISSLTNNELYGIMTGDDSGTHISLSSNSYERYFKLKKHFNLPELDIIKVYDKPEFLHQVGTKFEGYRNLLWSEEYTTFMTKSEAQTKLKELLDVDVVILDDTEESL